jgi:hypothetical protein
LPVFATFADPKHVQGQRFVFVPKYTGTYCPIKGEGWKNSHKKLHFAPSLLPPKLKSKRFIPKYTHYYLFIAFCESDFFMGKDEIVPFKRNQRKINYFYKFLFMKEIEIIRFHPVNIGKRQVR